MPMTKYFYLEHKRGLPRARAPRIFSPSKMLKSQLSAMQVGTSTVDRKWSAGDC